MRVWKWSMVLVLVGVWVFYVLIGRIFCFFYHILLTIGALSAASCQCMRQFCTVKKIPGKVEYGVRAWHDSWVKETAFSLKFLGWKSVVNGQENGKAMYNPLGFVENNTCHSQAL